MKKNLSIVCTALMTLGLVLNVHAKESQEETIEKNSAEEATLKECTDKQNTPSSIMKRSFIEQAQIKKNQDDIERAIREFRQVMEIEINTIKFLKFKTKIGEIFVPNSTVADIEMIDDKSLYLSGLAPGTTSLVIHDKEGRILCDYQVKVTYPLKEIKNSIAKVYPDTEIDMISLEDNLVLKGKVPSPEMASDVADIVSRFVDKDKIINKLTIETATQVMLKVKVAEVTRKVTKDLGISWRALDTGAGPGSAMVGFVHGTGAFPEYMADVKTGKTDMLAKENALFSSRSGGRWFVSAGANNLAALIDALATESFASILAEPSLIALSGKSATFKSGGEQGYTVRQTGDDANTTEFKEWGTSIEFTPYVLSEDRINIKVKAEVSSLGTPNEDGTPNLNTKNVETVVELGSGQSLALAGLVQTSKDNTTYETPLLADIPFLGSLFKQSRVTKNENELVIIVTPYVVKPSSQKLRSPTDSAPKMNSPLDTIVARSFFAKSGFFLK